MELLQIIVMGVLVMAAGAFAFVAMMRRPTFYPELEAYLKKVQAHTVHISADRKRALNELRDYAVQSMYQGRQASFLFLCVENCGRSIMAQVWMETMARTFELPNLLSYSGGTQPEQLQPGMIKALHSAGLQVKLSQEMHDKHMTVQLGPQYRSLNIFAKYFNDTSNPQRNFMAVATDKHTVPLLKSIKGASAQVALKYHQPHNAEEAMELNFAIATEMMYLCTRRD